MPKKAKVLSEEEIAAKAAKNAAKAKRNTAKAAREAAMETLYMRANAAGVNRKYLPTRIVLGDDVSETAVGAKVDKILSNATKKKARNLGKAEKETKEQEKKQYYQSLYDAIYAKIITDRGQDIATKADDLDAIKIPIKATMADVDALAAAAIKRVDARKGEEEKTAKMANFETFLKEHDMDPNLFAKVRITKATDMADLKARVLARYQKVTDKKAKEVAMGDRVKQILDMAAQEAKEQDRSPYIDAANIKLIKGKTNAEILAAAKKRHATRTRKEQKEGFMTAYKAAMESTGIPRNQYNKYMKIRRNTKTKKVFSPMHQATIAKKMYNRNTLKYKGSTAKQMILEYAKNLHDMDEDAVRKVICTRKATTKKD